VPDQTRTLKVGDAAPDFTLKGTGNSTFTLNEHRGKNVVLAFFPAAFSPVCSQQMPRIQAQKAAFDSSDAVVAGISVDNTWALDAFANQTAVDFPILSDFHPHGAVSESYGVLHQAGVSERAIIGIDKEGTVRYIDVSPAFTEIPDTEPCLTALRA
jgi:peroxiredoxin